MSGTREYVATKITFSSETTSLFTRPATGHASQIKHILAPANKGNSDTCKLLLSAVVNNYELITFYNFNKTGDKMAKISGGLDYMMKLNSSHDDELLLIVDAFDEWFQLPAIIMENRYHEINRRENERILTRTGKPYRQSIIISTQRQCWPGNGADISCYTAPESPLPAYVFGPETDNMIDGWNKYSKLRSRYMNAGFTMGPVKDMRKLWIRAQEYSQQNPRIVGLDQNVLSRIWGEQNYMREYARFTNEPLVTERPDFDELSTITSEEVPREGDSGRRQRRGLGYPPNNSNPKRKPFTPKSGKNYEFGVGLDYGSELSLPTVFAEFDADWLTFSNSTSLHMAFDAQNVTNPGATRLQDDIADLESLPFAALQAKQVSTSAPEQLLNNAWDKEEGEQLKALDGMAMNTTWRDIPLFTNMWTGISPAIVHHNAWRDGMKSRRRTTWESMWFQPYARQLLDAWVQSAPEASSESSTIVGRKRSLKELLRRLFKRKVEVAGEMQGLTRVLGAYTDNDEQGNWVNWGELCGEGEQREVFRDHEGNWVGPGGSNKTENRTIQGPSH